MTRIDCDGLDGAERLAVAMLTRALADGDLEWLCSSKAYLWYDILSISPEAARDALRARVASEPPSLPTSLQPDCCG